MPNSFVTMKLLYPPFSSTCLMVPSLELPQISPLITTVGPYTKGPYDNTQDLWACLISGLKCVPFFMGHHPFGMENWSNPDNFLKNREYNWPDTIITILSPTGIVPHIIYYHNPFPISA